ncbi:MAG: ABC transporter permease [Acidimicrobiia bacterium]|nr:ABC transporter permease [Acidimicrobiia bacterium]NND13805.1 ABC transporter permease [Acidimicrobiia bacterium]
MTGDIELPDEPTGHVDDDRVASLWGDAWRALIRKPVFVISGLLIIVIVLMAAFPGLFTSKDPRACPLSEALQTPSAEHWFGTDVQGCDYYARTIYGARVSITIGLIVTTFALTIALIGGSISGYYGGLVDTLIARVTDMWFAIPTILGGIVILALFQQRGVAQVSLVLIVLGWPTMLRLVRSSVISVKETEYVDSARALGATDFRIITRHILPNSLAPVIVYATITVGVVIAAEAALSFLNVGLQLPAISWGLMISNAQNRILTAPHLLLFPGAVLSVTVFSFILMGDALRDALDPKLR